MKQNRNMISLIWWNYTKQDNLLGLTPLLPPPPEYAPAPLNLLSSVLKSLAGYLVRESTLDWHQLIRMQYSDEYQRLVIREAAKKILH